MAVPVHDDGTPGPTRRLILFVHGFNSSSGTWDRLRDLLAKDPAITSEFDLQEFAYETGITALRPDERLPRLQEAGLSLSARLQTEVFAGQTHERYIDVTLVGHSMGGLIIQSCLLSLLKPSGSQRTLDQIRQVILFATPNLGSTALGRVRRMLSSFIDNPQERALRLFNEVTTQIHGDIHERVISASRRARDEYPIPFYCFWGRTDAVVLAESARGHFPAGEPLPGNHFRVHVPESRTSPAYVRFTELLRRPYGHPSVWEVDRFSTSIAVAPVPPGSAIRARHGNKERVVVHDNVATIRRAVTFSPGNTCRTPFLLKYGTRNGGFVEPSVSGPHVTSPDKVRLYDEGGCEAQFEIAPQPGATTSLLLKVYKGFDEGHRDYHMHLGRSAYYRHVDFTVDLSAYRSAGWDIVAPELYFHASDPGDHALCGQRAHVNPDPPAHVDPAGIWKWELEFVTEGVLDLAWDVRPSRREDAPTRVQLQAGEDAVFGYGSLFSVASLERTLGRSYTGPFLPVFLTGWRRRWNVWMPNRTYQYRQGDAWITPPRIFYLNVEPQPASTVNGVLFVASDADLARLDARESIYDRVDVTDHLAGVTVVGGRAWVYRGKPEYVSNPPAHPEQGAVRRTYVDILTAGFQTMGREFQRLYDSSTDPVPQTIVVDDVRHDEAAV